jgi:hypothetical protein
MGLVNHHNCRRIPYHIYNMAWWQRGRLRETHILFPYQRTHRFESCLRYIMVPSFNWIGHRSTKSKIQVRILLGLHMPPSFNWKDMDLLSPLLGFESLWGHKWRVNQTGFWGRLLSESFR